MSAAMPKANGIVMPTKPVYSAGGWITISGFCSSGFMPAAVGGTSARNVSNGLLCTTIRKRKNISTTAMIATT